MKTMTGRLLLALLLAVCQVYGGTIPSLQKEHVYVYEYEGRVATGVAEDDLKYFTGFGVKSRLTVYTKDEKVFFKLDGTTMGLVNQKVENFYDALPVPYAEPETQLAKDVAVELEKPFAAVYDDGVFKSFYDPADRMTEWRKSIVGLFQTQFHPAKEHDSHFYTVNEDGVGGKCKTLYKIAHIPSEDTHVEEVLNLTKVRFYDECENRPHYFFTSLFGGKCNMCKDDYTKPLRTFARVEYKIKGNKQQYTIEKVKATGLISFTPFSSHGQTVHSGVNQSLTLLSETHGEAPFVVAVEEYKKIDTLSFEFYPEKVEDGQEIKNFHYNRVYKMPEVENEIEKLQDALASVVKAYKEGDKESHDVLKIIYQLIAFDYEHLEDLFQNHVNFGADASKDEKTVRSVLLEVLPYVGTNAAVKYMLHLIEHHIVNQDTASEMMSKFPFYVKDYSTDILQVLEEFLNKKDVKETLKNWNAGILAYGTLIHKACIHDDLHPHTNGMYHHKHPELCAKHVKVLKDKFYHLAARSPKDAGFYLRALRNAAHPDAYELYRQVLVEDRYPNLLKQTALFAFASFADEKPEEVAAVVAPIFFDHRNAYAMRIYAFEVLLGHFATPEFLTNLILSLETEPNEKVASYIFSYVGMYANITDPCTESLSEKARYVLHYAKPHQDYDVIRHASTHIFSAYNAKYRFGRKFQYGYIPNDHSLFPRELYMVQSFNMLGYNFPVFGVQLVNEEDNPLTAYQDNFAPAALRYDQDRETPDYIKDIVNKLHLDETRQPGDDDPRYQLYIRMFGNVAKATHKYQNDDSSNVVIDGNKLKYDVHSISYAEAEYIIPNEMGFPVVLSVKVPATVHFGGSATFQPRFSKGIAGHVDVDAHFSAEFFVNARMFVYTPSLAKTGYSLETTGGLQFPIKGSLDIDTHTHKFALKYIPSSEPYELFHYDTTPGVIIPGQMDTTPIKYSDHPTTKAYRIGHDYFGVGLKYNFQYDYTWNDYGSYRDFLKSFFDKPTRYEDYFYITDKLYSGTRGIVDYAMVNPSAKPFHLHVTFEPSRTNPTTEFLLSFKSNHTTYFEEKKGHDTCQSTVSLVAHGPVERKWETKFSVSTTYPEDDYRKVAIHFERSPIPNYDEKKFEMHYKSDVTYVNYLTIFSEKPEEVKVRYNGRLTIGDEDIASSKEVIVKVLAEQSEEYKTADKTNVWYYKKCKQDMEHNAFFTDACWRVMKDTGRIDKITFDIEYKNIPAKYKIFALHLYSCFRHVFYNNLHIDYLHGSRQENHVNVVANFSYHYPVFDLKITRPDQTVYYNKVYAPSVFPKYEPFTIAEDASDRHARMFFNYQKPMCFVTGDRVHTFDGTDYQFNEDNSKCYHLVMGDCKNHHFFAFVKKVDTPKMDKAVKFYFHDDVIEAVPSADGEKLELYVNGERKEDAHGYIHSVTNHPDYKLKISFYDVLHSVVIEADDYGVMLYSDGKNTCFVPNNFYRGRQCGLCGDLDGETYHDLKKPDGTPLNHKEMNHFYQYHKDGSDQC